MNKNLISAIKAVAIIILTHTFSLTTQANNGIIPYSDFNSNATISKSSIVLNWSATTETAIEVIEVERSTNNQQYATIGLVMGAEKSENNKDYYSYKDALKNLTGHSVVYYRQKIVYTNGTVSYSAITVVRLNNN